MTKKNEKRSFVMYDSFLEAMKHLNDAEFRECVLKIRDYALEGIDEESQSPYVNIILAMAKPNLDSARRRYEVAVENGKKGAEFGKLGGAPKDNQNARKNNPQSTPKQPLDVDANENVDVNEDENDDIDVYVAADGTSGKQGFSSSFSNSSNSVLRERANDSERLKKNEEKKEPPTEEQPSHSNTSVVGVADKGKGEIPLYPKDSFISSAPRGTGSVGEAGSSAARPRRREVKTGVYDQGEYYRLCFNNYMLDLVDMRLGKLPQDDNLFWQAVNVYQAILGNDDKKEVAKTVSHILSELVKAHK
ncbi:MAG: hypothetical protein IJX68_03640 [Rikenellaceae bacterium]|nr:hypothetical protein [Rikenellaceae bacterium]